VEPGRIYHLKTVDVSGLPEEAITDAPKAGDVYSAARINDWIGSVTKRVGRRANWDAHYDHAHAQVTIAVRFDAEYLPEPK